MKEIGMRVGAILSANKEQMNLLGYGVYDGKQESPFGFPNPRITLDDGSVVWGAQCWWGAEEKVRESIGDRKVVLVDIEGNPK